MKHLKGDAITYLIECDGPAVLAHQTNCLGIMGGGIAYQIKNMFPEVFRYYSSTCKRESGNARNLMGNAQLCMLDRYPGKFVCNLFGQLAIGTNERQTNYVQLAHSLIMMDKHLVVEGLQDANIIFPYKMASDRGGGDWKFVQQLIGEVFPNAIIVELIDKS